MLRLSKLLADNEITLSAEYTEQGLVFVFRNKLDAYVAVVAESQPIEAFIAYSVEPALAALKGDACLNDPAAA